MSEIPAFKLPNFEVLGLLGRGGMASVWKARQVSLDRYVAVKILSSSFATDPDDIQRFREEARAAAQLKHPGIVQVYDANFSDGVYYFVMELVDGYTLGDLLVRDAVEHPNRDAIVITEGQPTYVQLYEQASRMARGPVKLREQGLRTPQGAWPGVS